MKKEHIDVASKPPHKRSKECKFEVVQHMSEETAKKACEFLIRCYYENLGYEVASIII